MGRAIGRYHWLHPVNFLLLTAVFPLISYGILHFNMELAVFVYLGLIAVFVAPFFLFDIKAISEKAVYKTEYNAFNLCFWGILYILLFGVRITQTEHFNYEVLSEGTPAWLYWGTVFSWLCIYRLTELILPSIYRFFVVIPVVLEGVLLSITGQRLWLVMFGMGLLVILHQYKKKLTYYHLVLGIVIFLLVVGPIGVIFRYSIIQDLDKWETFKQELVYYPQKVEDTAHRVSQKGAVLWSISQHLSNRTFSSVQRPLSSLWQDVKTAAIPNILKTDDHNLKPGLEVFRQFNETDEARIVNLPNGLIGGISWYGGWWAFIILPSLSMGLIILWNNLLCKVCEKYGVTAIHFTYFFVLFDTHLLFWTTSWTRAILIYGLFLVTAQLIHSKSRLFEQ